MPISNGLITLNNNNIENWSYQKKARHFAFLSQNLSMSSNLVVKDIILMGGYAWKKNQRNLSLIKIISNMLNIEKLLNNYYNQLSGGEKQLIHFARLLFQLQLGYTKRTQFLFLDEPTTYLDMNVQILIFRMLKNILSDSLGIILVLHDLNIALHYTNHVKLMKFGKIIKEGDPKNILNVKNIYDIWNVQVKIIQYNGKSFIIQY